MFSFCYDQHYIRNYSLPTKFYYIQFVDRKDELDVGLSPLQITDGDKEVEVVLSKKTTLCFYT